MSLDFKKALFIPFQSENLPKVGIAIALYLPALLSVTVFGAKNPLTSILTFLASFLIAGYILISGHNELQNKETLLPDWDFANSAIVALQSTTLNLVYMLVIVPFIIIFAILMAFNKEFIPLLILLAIPIVLSYMILTSVAQSLFLENLKFTDAFDINKVLNLFKSGYGKYLIYFLWFILVGFIYGFSFGIIMVIIKMTTLFMIQPAYLNFVNLIAQVFISITAINLLAQTYKSIQNR